MEYKRDKLRNLFIVNPAILKKKKIYLWISKKKEDIDCMAQSLHLCIIHNIYFSGFVTDCASIVGITVLNKQVYDVHTVIDEDAIILTGNENSHFYCSVEVLNPEINLSDIVIWGAGKNGKILADYFRKRNINIKFFIDSDCRKAGHEINGVKVYGKDKLGELHIGTSLIEALSDYTAIDKMIREQAPEMDCYLFHDYETDSYFAPCWLMYLREVLHDKNVYIYGYTYFAKLYSYCLTILDFCFAGFLADDWQYEDVYKQDHRVLRTEEVLYCENYFVIVASDRKEASIKRLQELGLRYAIDFTPADFISYNLLYARKNVIDTNLGHTYRQSNGMNGIEIYGNANKGNYKIAVLGGSTSDGKLFPFKSWPRIMFEKINSEKVIVYNGGVSGYTSAQELIKLIRDIILLEPDMVLVYDGYNDTNERNACPGKYFDFTYLKKALDFAQDHMERGWDFLSQEDYAEGESPVPILGNFENWLLNIELMHAITADRGIRFYSFLQPMLSGKEHRSETEAGILFEAEYFAGLQQTSSMGKEFRKQIRNVLKSHDYIYDLSHIFDNIQNVYMDICHVRENANEVIADEILKRIRLGKYQN